MFVNHRYSDIVSLVDAMTRAGMECKNSVFVSTPYPFRKSVSYQLRRRGLRTIVPRLDSSRFALAVEVGIRRMLRTHEQQRRSWGHGKPILILDDGGMAAKIIAAKFPEHVSKFRIVEITAAGHRLAREFKEKYKRLPLVYYSLAYTRAKKKVTSRFFGTRVADRVVNLIPQTGIRPKNKRVAILGGGPMGIYVGIRLRSLGYDVTFVDPDRKAQRKLRWLKFDYKPIEEALPGRSIILGMSGYRTLKRGHLRYIDDGAFVAQGSSKRREFDMVVFETKAKKTLLPRTDGLAQKSYTYTFKPGPGGKSKRLHFLGDGWTINHDGSLHGTPMRDIQLELALYFESAVQAASTPLSRTGAFREVSGQTQRLYYNKWRELTGQR
jgi:S-adenosylhomocysteine hydrolase